MILTNTKYMIAICAVFVLLVGGVTMAGSSVDADGATEYTETPIKFTVDGQTYWKNVEKAGAANIKLPSLSDLGCTLKDGKEFKGWYIDEPETGYTNEPCYPAGTVVGYTFEDDSKDNDVFTAYTVDIQYVVSFVDGNEKQDIKGIYNQKFDVPAVVPAEGYTFGGWIDGDGAALVVIPAHDKVKDQFEIKGNAVYTAQYDRDPVVTFVIDGTITYQGNVSTMVYPVDPVKESYEFIGWSIDGETVVLDAGIEDGAAAVKTLGLDEDTTFTAVFEPGLHTVVFTVNGEAVSTQTVKHGDLATEPAFTPSVDGMDFVKWDYDFTQPVLEDTTIEAVFAASVPPEPTGLDDPVVLTMIILALIGLGAVFCVFMWLKKSGRIVVGRGPGAGKP